MHILDLIMYVLFICIIHYIIYPKGDSSADGGSMGLVISTVFTIGYICIFVVGSCNWVDIFKWFYDLGITL